MGAEFFKSEITPKKGQDKVEIVEGAMMNQINSRQSDLNFVDMAVKALRANVIRLNDKLAKAQGLSGTSVNGLSDSEIALAAKIAVDKLNSLGENFLREAGKFKESQFDPSESAEAKTGRERLYDGNRADLMKLHLINPVNNFLNTELDNVMAVVDDKDADEGAVMAAITGKKEPTQTEEFAERIPKETKGAIAKHTDDLNKAAFGAQ